MPREWTEPELHAVMREVLAFAKDRGLAPRDLVKVCLGLVVHICHTYASTTPATELEQCAENLRRYAKRLAPRRIVIHEDETTAIRLFDLTRSE